MLVPRGRVLLHWAVAFVLLVVTIVVLGNVGAGGTVAAGVSVMLLGLLMAGLRGQPRLPAVIAERPGPGGRRQSRFIGTAAYAVAVPLFPGLILPDAAPSDERRAGRHRGGLPFISAVALALVASWRIGAWINTGSASLQFVVAFALAWSAGTAETHLVLLTSLVAMTVSWFGRRDIAALLTARSLNRQRVRFYHIGYQTLIGGHPGRGAWRLHPVLIWLALAVAVAAAAVVTGAATRSRCGCRSSRLLLSCGIGLMLALLGTLLLGMAPELAGWFLLLGYAALAGWCRCILDAKCGGRRRGARRNHCHCSAAQRADAAVHSTEHRSLAADGIRPRLAPGWCHSIVRAPRSGAAVWRSPAWRNLALLCSALASARNRPRGCT